MNDCVQVELFPLRSSNITNHVCRHVLILLWPTDLVTRSLLANLALKPPSFSRPHRSDFGDRFAFSPWLHGVLRHFSGRSLPRIWKMSSRAPISLLECFTNNLRRCRSMGEWGFVLQETKSRALIKSHLISRDLSSTCASLLPLAQWSAAQPLLFSVH